MGGVRSASDVFRAIADPTRREMLDLLREGDRSVAELARPFRMSRPAIYQHVRVLRDARLVRALWRGGQRRYRLNRRRLDPVYLWVARYRELADPFGHRWAVVDAGPPRTRPAKPPRRGRSVGKVTGTPQAG